MTGGWLAFGASVRGPEHEHEGGICQDASEWSLTEGGAIVCVSDGAGSASHSLLGAQAAVRAAVGSLRASPRSAAPAGQPAEPSPLAGARSLEDAVRAACVAGREALLREAEALSLAPRDLACTLVLAVARGGRVAVAHLGDGAVVARRSGTGELFVMSAPDRGEYAGETWFLTSPQWQGRLRVAVEESVDAFCAFTDGCQEASLERGRPPRPFAPFCAPLFDFAGEVTDTAAGAEEVRLLLESASMRRSSGDDKTLAVALRRPEASRCPPASP